MITNNVREYLIDFFNWFPVEDRQEAIKSLAGFGDHALGLYDHFREADRRTMEQVEQFYEGNAEKIAYFTQKTPGLRCFLWAEFTRFLLNPDIEDIDL